MDQAPASGEQRFHHLDAARALFMLMGIPFHASLAFAGGHWLVMSGSRDPVLSLLPPILSDFRMPGFFLIAGFFGAMLLERRARGEWLKGRAERLGVPLLFGVLAIVPIQAAIIARAPTEIVDRAAGASVLSHLWFLPTLLLLSVLLALAWPLVMRLEKLPVPRVVTLAIAIGIYELALYVGQTLLGSDLSFAAGFVDLGSAAAYLPFFAIGIAMRRSPAMWTQFSIFNPTILALGLVALMLHTILWDDLSRVGLALDLLCEGISSLCLTQAVLAGLMRFVRRGSEWLDRLVDASLTIYLLHHPVVVVLAIYCIAEGRPPIASWLAICLAALLLPYMAHRLIRRSPLALWLLNGVRHAKKERGLLVSGRSRAGSRSAT